MKKNRSAKAVFAICVVLVALVSGVNHMVGRCSDVGRVLAGVREEVLPAMGVAVGGGDDGVGGDVGDGDVGGESRRGRRRSRRAAEDLERPAALQGRSERIIEKSQFVISYNSDYFCPNYVCWRLDAERVGGEVARTDNFHADPALGGGLVVETSDYSGSGYDRGHMCPAGDNKNSAVGMDESFCMTNVCPQNSSLNRGAWNELEQQCRDWARDYGTIYICCGPIFDSGSPRRIGRRRDVRVAVPDRFFKVVLYLGRVSKAIGFVYPNEACVEDIRHYAVSVDSVEAITGMDFFFQLDDELERRLESDCSPGAWGI